MNRFIMLTKVDTPSFCESKTFVAINKINTITEQTIGNRKLSHILLDNSGINVKENIDIILKVISGTDKE